MPFKYDRQHLTGQQRAIAAMRDRVDEEYKKKTVTTKEEYDYSVIFNALNSFTYGDLLDKIKNEFKTYFSELESEGEMPFQKLTTHNLKLKLKKDIDPHEVRDRFAKVGEGLFEKVFVERME
ncbi:hypothetical protein E2R60_20725 [Paenibacillus dendritiformis]|uniref:hypothetical protein n=1 Tax=Paenibacillus dendritiformis TaxID=130049 RepID=UPI001059D802|nr:hypothetical protein [Paenibacillus dendritiformis]TDL50972.1 hypothetical protein E2R60_20725 [Paenibacillus dendritiformis]